MLDHVKSKVSKTCYFGILSILNDQKISMHVVIPVQVTCGDVTETFHVRYIGTKGDWPFLRAAFRLKTGYTSKRVCHLCPATESWHGNAYHFKLFLGDPYWYQVWTMNCTGHVSS